MELYTRTEMKQYVDYEVERKTLEMRKMLVAAHDALRSYQFGNSSPELAKEVADKIRKLLDLP